MNFCFIDINKAVVDAWKKEQIRRPSERIAIYHADIKALMNTGNRAIVSPANSFGAMDGGFDLVLRGWIPGLQEQVLSQLHASEYEGFIPVGCCLPVLVSHPDVKCLLVAPTMVVPYDVSKTINAFLAFRAVFMKARQLAGEIDTVICTGLGTAAGSLAPDDCAKQMFAAYWSLINGMPKFNKAYEAINYVYDLWPKP